jgi:hypothetical protein
MDIKRKGEASLFCRTSPGRYTLRTLAGAATPAPAPMTDGAAAQLAASAMRAEAVRPPQPMSALPARKPAVAAAPAAAPARARTEGDVGNGLAG